MFKATEYMTSDELAFQTFVFWTKNFNISIRDLTNSSMNGPVHFTIRFDCPEELQVLEGFSKYMQWCNQSYFLLSCDLDSNTASFFPWIYSVHYIPVSHTKHSTFCLDVLHNSSTYLFILLRSTCTFIRTFHRFLAWGENGELDPSDTSRNKALITNKVVAMKKVLKRTGIITPTPGFWNPKYFTIMNWVKSKSGIYT